MSAAALTLKAVESQITLQNVKSSEAEIKRCEDLILAYAKQLSIAKDAAGIQNLMESIRSFYEVIGKARASKLIRQVVEYCLIIDQGKEEKVSMLKNCIEWASTNQRQFLRRNLQSRLVKLYNDVREYTAAQKLAHQLVTELKKLEDRELLIEVSLEESKSAFYLNNFAKAKCSLVAAKTNANGAYISTQLQAAIDLQSGILYSAEEKDFKTSYSYFYESFEGFSTSNDKPNTIKSLKYMVLCKIMLNETEHIPTMMATKEMMKVKGKEIDAIRAMADAFRKRSLKAFQKALDENKKELLEDKVVTVHSRNLERNMLEKEISRVIEPYSEIELAYISRNIGLESKIIEKAICRMILDKKLFGSIDQRCGTIIIYPQASSTKVFTRAMTSIREVGKTVDAMYERANKNIK